MPHDAYILLDPAGIERISGRVGARPVEAEEGKPYCRVRCDDFRAPEEWLRDISRDLNTEVLWLVMQKQSDAFAFQRWVNGELRRRLTYGVDRERTWEEVSGTPEPWEPAILFSLKRLDRKLKVLELTGVADKANELKRIWTEQRIEVGSGEPSVSAASAGPEIAHYYRLPGWA